MVGETAPLRFANFWSRLGRAPSLRSTWKRSISKRGEIMSVKPRAGKAAKASKFKSEAEEAEWWDRNPDFIADQFEKAAKEGRILRGLPGRGATRSVTIRLAMKDVETAQVLA